MQTGTPRLFFRTKELVLLTDTKHILRDKFQNPEICTYVVCCTNVCSFICVEGAINPQELLRICIKSHKRLMSWHAHVIP